MGCRRRHGSWCAGRNGSRRRQWRCGRGRSWSAGGGRRVRGKESPRRGRLRCRSFTRSIRGVGLDVGLDDCRRWRAGWERSGTTGRSRGCGWRGGVSAGGIRRARGRWSGERGRSWRRDGWCRGWSRLGSIRRRRRCRWRGLRHGGGRLGGRRVLAGCGLAPAGERCDGRSGRRAEQRYCD